ncbi:MAG: recombination mediator RecR [Planctomycetota bacterium]
MTLLRALIERLQELPGIGPKSAERIAHSLVRSPPEEAKALAEALVRAVEGLRPCSRCGHVSETDPCGICADERRDPALLCVVESSRDLEALEATGEYRGIYHVLGGHVAPAEGVALRDLNLAALLDRVRDGAVKEVVLATNPTFEGEATSAMLFRELGRFGVRVTRIARGIPTGGEIVHMNAAVLGDALRGRAELHD